MKLAIIGSRSLAVNNISQYLPENVTEIVSGGARGIDRQAADYARTHHLKLTEFLPDYARYGRSAPLKRNIQIAEYADMALVFLDGVSKGTRHTVSIFDKLGKKKIVITMEKIQASAIF